MIGVGFNVCSEVMIRDILCYLVSYNPDNTINNTHDQKHFQTLHPQVEAASLHPQEETPSLGLTPQNQASKESPKDHSRRNGGGE